jgi:hypothetical protein
MTLVSNHCCSVYLLEICTLQVAGKTWVLVVYGISFNTMYNVQLAVKTELIYCTICTMYTQLHVSAHFRPSSGCFV